MDWDTSKFGNGSIGGMGKIRYHPLFECDVLEAARWYDRRSAGLGDQFVAEVRESVADVITDPDRHAASPAGVRYLRVSRFPYVVFST